ncbi:MAG: sigma-70 family RNA polymerase sigma factor [Caulobacteraceae bacterium]|nr:sigma-70 family RNA polymerase sigma factor [Caulobacteraceae bacterium]
MSRRYRLSTKRQKLVIEHMALATMLAKFFVQNRPSWQRGVLIPDLESEGFLALTKAARTYDPKKLPYPKAYFARAVLNAMYKSIKRVTRQPGVEKITLEQAEQLLPDFDELDHLRLAISELPEEDQELATLRFVRGFTLQRLANEQQIPLRVASRRSSRLAKLLAESLGIRCSLPGAASERPTPNSSRDFPASCKVSEPPACRGEGRWPTK